MSIHTKRSRTPYSLHQLELFAAVARLESFSRAAEELGVTQSAVSVQVRHLEEALGLPLFEYLGRKLYLTDAGREVQATTHTLFESLERLDMALAQLKGLKQGRLQLMTTTTAKYFVPRLLGSFCEQHPGIEVKLQVVGREEVLAGIENNVADLYVMGWPPARPNLTAIPFLENDLVIIARSDHPLARQKRITLARLAQEAFLMREPGSGTRLALEQLFASQGCTIDIRMELESNEAIKQAVLGGLGVAVMSRQALPMEAQETHEGQESRIAILDVRSFPLRGHWHAVHLTEKRLSVVAQAFLDHLRSASSPVALHA